MLPARFNSILQASHISRHTEFKVPMHIINNIQVSQANFVFARALDQGPPKKKIVY